MAIEIARKDKSGYNIPKSWDQTKGERKMAINKKTGMKTFEKQGIAAEVIKFLKEKHADLSAADRSKIMATAYMQALKEKKIEKSV